MTDTNNGWPGEPGVPMNPEKDGWHWVSLLGGDYPQIMEWFSDAMVWAEDWTVDACALHLRYLGPCLKPDEATALQKRADQSALGYAREARRADLFKFLHKRDVAALQARIAELEAAVATIHAERNQLIGVLQIAVEQNGDTEHPPAWVDDACRIFNRGFLKVDRAALEGGKE